MTVIKVAFSLPLCTLNLPLAARYFAGECKVSGTRSSTPHVAWSPPFFHLVGLASISIETVQAPITPSGPCFRFEATLLVPCPFAFEPNPASDCCVAEQISRCTVTLPTGIRARTERIGDDLGGESQRKESKGTYECCAA